MKKVLPNVTATSRITATSADQLAYLCNVQRLSQLFYTGHHYILSHNVTPAVWSTIHEPLADGFTRKYADPLCLLGVGFGDYTNYLMGDIDRRSKYHPSNDPQAFERLLDTLHRKGLTTPVVIQSSWSGGIHVYYFFDRDINTFRIASLSQVSLIDAKFQIADGTLELFPNCKPFASKFEDKTDHKRHRLPLQANNGGSILDRKGNPLMCGANLTHESQLQAFLQLAKASADGNDIDKIERQLDPFYAIFKSYPSKYQHMRKKGMSEKAKAWKQDLEMAMGIGWIDYQQTNKLIPRFIAYGIVFMGLEDRKELFEWVLEAITNANGYKRYCCHQHQIQARIWDWLKLTTDKQFYVKYCGYPPRSSGRDNFIAKHKVSKSFPTSKSEIYKRSRVDSVVSTITDVVETILSTIIDLPSRTEDLIRLIQSIARKKFGQAPSRNTLYKPHYKTIWVKLKATNKPCDIVLVTSNTFANMEYCPQTCMESAFEESVFCVTGLGKKDLKPIGGETSHSNRSVCSVNASSQLPPANPDPDLDPALNSKTNVPLDQSVHDRDKSIKLDPIQSDRLEGDLSLNPIDPDSIYPQSALASDLPNLDLDSRLVHNRNKLIEPDPIERPGVDLTSRFSYPHADSINPTSDHDQAKLIVPDLIKPDRDPIDSISHHDRDKSIESDREEDLSPDQTHSQLPTIPNSTDLDINPQPNQIEPATANLITPPSLDQDKSIEPDLIEPDLIKPDLIELSKADLISQSYSDQKPTLKYFKSLSLDQKLQLTEQQIQEIRLSRFPLIEGCFVRPFDKYHVHGADRGIVTQIQPWGVYVSWSDGTSGRYACDELICTYSPNLKY